MFAYIGRQPIYNKDYVIAGYELLYRNNASRDSAKIVDNDAATRSVLSDAVTVFGISQLTGGLPAYVNFTRNLLIDDFAYLARPSEIVVEIPGNLSVDEDVISKLNSLKIAGYKLSLSGYNESSGFLRFNRIIHLFDVVRLNVRTSNRLQLIDMIKGIRRRSPADLLAEQVETEQHFDTALNLDFSLFQGYYFERPVCLSKQVPLALSSYWRLFAETIRPNANFETYSRVIERDPVLSHQFLSQAPIARQSRNSLQAEIMRGLVAMGEENFRRWACLVLLRQMNVTNSDEMPRKAFLRGRFMERLIQNSDLEADPDQGFYVGLFSLLDQVMGISLGDLLADVPPGLVLRETLLGKMQNAYSRFLQFVMIYEMGNARLILPDIQLRIGDRQVAALYMSCINETDIDYERLSVASTKEYQGNIVW